MFANEYTMSEAQAFLKTKGIAVTRQSLHLFIQRHKDQCTPRGQRVDGAAYFWTIPHHLLATYAPSKYNQDAGNVRGEQIRQETLERKKKTKK